MAGGRGCRIPCTTCSRRASWAEDLRVPATPNWKCPLILANGVMTTCCMCWRGGAKTAAGTWLWARLRCADTSSSACGRTTRWPMTKWRALTLLQPRRPLRRPYSQGRAGSSAGGELPKFTARRALAGAATAEVIVKFSGVADAPFTQRWADLLVCEHLALRRVPALGAVCTAATRLVQAGGRSFLESERFDRVGAWGRRPLVSLRALNGHLLGLASQDWRLHAARLAALGLIDATTVGAIVRLWWCGRLVANNDMHLGNLSFHPQAGRLHLAPAYDVLPMAFAPLPGGEVPETSWDFELPMPAEFAAWQAAADAALLFWADAASDVRISTGFRARASARASALAQRFASRARSGLRLLRRKQAGHNPRYRFSLVPAWPHNGCRPAPRNPRPASKAPHRIGAPWPA